ncbi:F-box/WD repeat-containing protein 9-like [Uloborus diversus]|uniref:F-box/WD repeat-containing protein 9-like n=1 Tax=Uloborus diversus TaxID=327109 RepID=UPI00240903B5|nr:F-box/WD repeat-containing protein 9-like [Uloborus diversus]
MENNLFYICLFFQMDSESIGEEIDTLVLSLDTVPPEIFLHICSFLSSKFVINVLSSVCQKFKDVLESDVTWRLRIYERWPKKYPLVPVPPDFDWKEACIAREEQHRLWHKHSENMKKYHMKEAHFGSVNVVQIIEEGGICASGGRDGALKLWDLAALNEMLLETAENAQNFNPWLINERAGAHGNAWLWSIAYDKTNRVLYSGGFDCNLKTWELVEPSVQASSYSLASPVLCLSYCSNALSCGCYGRSVSLFDPRAGVQPMFQHILHKKPVICMVSDEKYIISGSEDCHVIIYDKIARNVLKTWKLDGFPMSMSYNDGQILVGDVEGSIHVIDPHEDYELLQSYKSGHQLKVTGIQHNLGSIITCSTDKTIRVLEPNAEPEPIAVLQGDAEVAKISFCNSILVSANADDSITVWKPREDLD